mgnify:CR=1 FL=1
MTAEQAITILTNAGYVLKEQKRLGNNLGDHWYLQPGRLLTFLIRALIAFKARIQHQQRNYYNPAMSVARRLNTLTKCSWFTGMILLHEPS